MYPVIQLQGIGRAPAKKAKEFKVGDVVGYNYGYKGKITSVSQKGKSVYWDVESYKPGATTSHAKYRVRKSAETLTPFF